MLSRNDGILDGILNEIASSFVSLTPRNDAGNSLLARNDGIPAMTDEFKIYRDEIPQSSWGMTKKVRSGEFYIKSRILRGCFASLAMTKNLEFHIEILGASPRMT